MRNFQTTVSLIIAPLLLLASYSACAFDPGDMAPDFRLPQLDGRPSLNLSDFRGKVVYIDFWASWCGPCRKSMPLYETMQLQLPEDSFQMIAINLDKNGADGLDFLRYHPVSYPVLADPASELARVFSITVMPTSFLLDRQGRISSIYAGFLPVHIEQIEQDIFELIENH